MEASRPVPPRDDLLRIDRGYAIKQDGEDLDGLNHIREEFWIPKISAMQSSVLPVGERDASKASGPHHVKTWLDRAHCTYLVGHSLGLQPKRTAEYLAETLAVWRHQGVQGHFKQMKDVRTGPWVDIDDRVSEALAPIVGAKPSEVVAMQTLTANLQLIMAAFYKPDVNGKHKIIVESRAFPSDHVAVETQITNKGLSPATSMVTMEPENEDSLIFSTDYVLRFLDKHGESTAMLVLPGVQYYTGQLFDIATITANARKLGIFVLWDLAHAVGNVELKLHDWDVDAAVWCSYKYLNAGPGSIGGMFIHERNWKADYVHVDGTGESDPSAECPGRPSRLAGWWANRKETRFEMSNSSSFEPREGALGFQLSNPSVLDSTSLLASLDVFHMADAKGGMEAIRRRSVRLTKFLYFSIMQMPDASKALFTVMTPEEVETRGAQLSIKLKPGLLPRVMEELAARGVFVDDRKPDVIRVAPAPLYNTFEDCYDFAVAFAEALLAASDSQC